MFKFILVIFFILNFNLAYAGITGTPAPKDHNAVANNSSDDNHDHNDEDDNSDHDHKDH
tara:strand:- start:1435 stop:1611 length:177 start_codon:yes stop_codon:yes gene_type:complete